MPLEKRNKMIQDHWRLISVSCGVVETFIYYVCPTNRQIYVFIYLPAYLFACIFIRMCVCLYACIHLSCMNLYTLFEYTTTYILWFLLSASRLFTLWVLNGIQGWALNRTQLTLFTYFLRMPAYFIEEKS